jgi:hypothetical protein
MCVCVRVCSYLRQQTQAEGRHWIVAPRDVESLEHGVALLVCWREDQTGAAGAAADAISATTNTNTSAATTSTSTSTTTRTTSTTNTTTPSNSNTATRASSSGSRSGGFLLTGYRVMVEAPAQQGAQTSQLHGSQKDEVEGLHHGLFGRARETHKECVPTKLGK